MQFSWAETPAHDGGSETTKVGGDLSTYENLYGNELQLFESFFNGNLNELDYLSDLSSLPEGTEPRSELPVSDPIDLLFVKHEPTSPQSSVGTPSSPGESSGPSSPETLFHHHISTLSTETIDPSSLTMPSAFSLGVTAEPLMEVKKQSAKRARLGSEEEDATAPLMPSTGVPEEERHVKRQRRLIKNRESAQKSRLRKKMYIEDLETKVKSLAAHNDALLQENSSLKEEINFLTKFINKTPGLAEEIAHSRPKGTAPIRNVKAAGVCLLIVLFSFGLFFNNVQQLGDHGPALPFEGGAREPVPEVVPFGGQRRYGHMLKSFKDAAAPLAAETEEAVGDLTPIFPKRRLPLADAGPLDAVIQRNKKVGPGLSPYKKIKLEEDSSMDVVDPSCMEELANGFVVPQLSSSSAGCPEEDALALAVSGLAHTGPRNDTGAETTGHTDN